MKMYQTDDRHKVADTPQYNNAKIMFLGDTLQTFATPTTLMYTAMFDGKQVYHRSYVPSVKP